MLWGSSLGNRMPKGIDEYTRILFGACCAAEEGKWLPFYCEVMGIRVKFVMVSFGENR